MSGPIILGPSGPLVTDDVESLELDGLELNDGLVFEVFELDLTPPEPRIAWSDAPDQDGAIQTGDEHFENRVIGAKLRVEREATTDGALAQLALIVAKLRKAVQNRPGGIPLVWNPHDSTKALTFYVLYGEVVDLPIGLDEEAYGWLLNTPVVELRLICRPFGYNPVEQSIAEVTFSTPQQSIEIPDVGGDVPAEGRLVASDEVTSPGQGRKFLEVGIEQRYYDPTADLFLEGSDLSITGTQATNNTTDTGALNTNCRQLVSLLPAWQDFVKVPDMPLVGPFRWRARAKNYTNEAEVRLRILYRAGSSPWVALPSAIVPRLSSGAFTEVDLGELEVREDEGKLDVIVQAWSDISTDSNEGIRLDFLGLTPIDAHYSVVRGGEVAVAGAGLDAFDDFTHDLGLAVNGTTSPSGDVWAGAGDADTFYITGAYAERAAAADADLDTGRYLTFGSSLAAMRVIAYLFLDNLSSTQSEEVRGGILLRYVDTSNWLGLFIRKRKKSHGYLKELSLRKRKAGAVTVLQAVDIEDSYLRGPVGTIAADVSATGVVSVFTGREVLDAPHLEFTTSADADLATGGTLASGKGGIYGANTTGRKKGSVAIGPVAVYSATSTLEDLWSIPPLGRCEIDHEKALAYNAAGDPSRFVRHRGGRLYIPPAGEDDRTSRLIVRARDADVDAGRESVLAGLTRSTAVQVFWHERYLVAPR